MALHSGICWHVPVVEGSGKVMAHFLMNPERIHYPTFLPCNCGSTGECDYCSPNRHYTTYGHPADEMIKREVEGEYITINGERYKKVK